MDEDEIEDWEGELEEGLQGPRSHTRDWSDLLEIKVMLLIFFK